MKSLQIAAIDHIPWLEYRHTLSDGRVCIRLRTGKGEFDAVTLRYAHNYAEGAPFSRAWEVPMERMWRDETHEVWQAVFMPEDPRILYCFLLRAQGVRLVHDAGGTRAEPQNPADVKAFHFAHAYPAREKPQWARGCVGYQIFPDRFRRVDVPGEEPVEPWGSPRVANEYRFGGNLKGILEAVPYLRELGVGVVYMTPIFLSDTSHRYNTFDYYQIDPLLGSLEDLRTLADALHAGGIRIVLDGVFNHCGLGFAPFQDALQNGRDSRYADWFFFGEQYPCGYMTFGEKWAYMPKLNMQNPDCAAYFLNVGRYWLREAHVDGWRLDVSPEVWPDFWRQFRRAVLDENPDAILIAECWDDSREWCSIGDMFDGTMHYVLSDAIWGFFAEGRTDLAQFDAEVNRAMMLYPQEVQNSMWNFLSSHDTARMLTRCGNQTRKMRAAAFFQMTHPGVPVIYYGDELGMRGGPDPDCRRCMTWERVPSSRMLAYYRRLTQMRGSLRVLREGTLITHEVGGDGLYAYLRRTEDALALCVLNTSAARLTGRTLALPRELAGEKRLLDALSGRRIAVRRGLAAISLAPGEGMVLLKAQRNE
ncbi:MAG TPA: alpha amylase N-terminal ig-like domain-containing protein [Candidatus Ventricola intestinavium]|nr:alpha amylase N-terminal ig-like domain-containing protein [Candidatus Ventricola intestinavium]